MKEALEYIDQIESAMTIQNLKEKAIAFAENIGLTHFVIAEIANPLDLTSDYDMYLSRAPEDFQTRWLSEGYGIHDPNFLMTLASNAPWTYEYTYKRSKARGRRILDEAKSFGMHDGFVAPIHSFNSRPGCVSISGPVHRNWSDDDLASYSLVASHLFMKFKKLMKRSENTFSLTDREIDILSLIAAGYRGSNITDRLHISDQTLKTHLKNIRQKTETVSTSHAVARAISARQIIP